MPFSNSYAFVAGDHMTSVTASNVPSTGKDGTACLAAGDKLLKDMIGVYGDPDKNILDKKGVGLGSVRRFEFLFRDGSGIYGDYGLVDLMSVFCDVELRFWSPTGKDDFAPPEPF